MKETRRAFLAALVGAVAVAAAPQALARGRARFRYRGLPNGAKSSAPVMSREHLRQCVAQQNDLNLQSSNVDSLQAALTKDEQALNDLSARITAQEPLVDRYSQESIDSFNALVGKHERMVNAYNAKLPAVNAKVNQANDAVASFNAKCAERLYYESDMQAVLAGR